MSQDDIWLVCEGEPKSRDVRWFNLVLSHLGESSELASRVRVMPSGSKADLQATVRGMRQALRTPLVYAIRDRDFLRAELLGKDEAAGVYSLQRHCLESYLVEPDVLGAALGLTGAEQRLVALAQSRFWADLARAVLDDLGYELRKDRLRLEDEVPTSTAEVAETVRSKLDAFRSQLAAKPVDVERLVELFEQDMRSAPLWTRVNGKELMRSLAGQLGPSALPGRDIEAALFKWCERNGPPAPFSMEMERILAGFPAV